MTSDQVATLMTNQVSRFGNVNNYSQQISPAYPAMGQMQGPPAYQSQKRDAFNFGFQSQSMGDPTSYALGTRMAGGVMGGANVMGGAMLGGLGLYGAMSGTGLGMLDPFTGTMRMGGAGMRMGGSMGARIGMGGAGRVIGGMMGGGAALGGYAAAGAALNYTAGEFFRGGRQQAELDTSLNKRYGFMNVGSRTGFGFSRQESLGVGQKMRGLEDAFTELAEVHRVVDKLGQMGFARNSRGAEEFGRKMTEAIKTVKTISRAIGTTLEEAVPLFAEARRAGIYNNADIVKNASNMSLLQTYGIEQPGAAQAGMAGMAQQFGGTRRAGARMFGGLARTLGAGVSTGMISEGMMTELSGGLEGGEALSAVVQRMGGGFYQAMQRNPGMFAGVTAGLLKQGTTELDENIVNRFSQGDISAEALTRRGQENLGALNPRERGRFLTQSKRLLSDAMGGEQGAGVMYNLAESLAESRQQDVETFLTQVMGFDREMAEMITKVGKDHEQMTSRARQDQRQNARQRFINTRRRMEGSVSGQLRKIGYAAYQMGPQQIAAAGAGAFSSMAEATEDVGDWFTGRETTFVARDAMLNRVGKMVRGDWGGGPGGIHGSGMGGAELSQFKKRMGLGMAQRYGGAGTPGEHAQAAFTRASAGMGQEQRTNLADMLSGNSEGAGTRAGLRKLYKGRRTKALGELGDILGVDAQILMGSVKSESQRKEMVEFLGSRDSQQEVLGSFLMKKRELGNEEEAIAEIADELGVEKGQVQMMVAVAKKKGEVDPRTGEIAKLLKDVTEAERSLAGVEIPAQMREAGAYMALRQESLRKGGGGPGAGVTRAVADVVSAMTKPGRGMQLGGALGKLYNRYQKSGDRGGMEAYLRKVGGSGIGTALRRSQQLGFEEGEELAGTAEEVRAMVGEKFGMSGDQLQRHLPNIAAMLEDREISSTEMKDIRKEFFKFTAAESFTQTGKQLVFDNPQRMANALTQAVDDQGFIKVVDLGRLADEGGVNRKDIMEATRDQLKP